ncbi:MAG: DegQ family serine endoprotease, partial [Candidatus Marinimicrobia bacterium]|nr:DegQ family serine endoprotease [Candidatus Neomarinimicrobiota bacterium]
MKNNFTRSLILLFTLTTLSMASLLDELSKDVATIAEKVSPSVVTITAEKIMKQSSPFGQIPNDFFFFGPQSGQDKEIRSEVLGSGVIVGKGIILTNNHVVENAENITVHLSDRREIKATLLGTDPKSDIAVLQVEEKDLPAIKIGNSDDMKVGAFVLAIGSPFSDNLNTTVTLGIVSALGRSSVGIIDYENFIQTDAAINPGNSGGALINSKGELIGINTAIASRSGGSQGIGFAIPINLVKRNMEDIITEGRVIRAWVGVQIQKLDQAIASSLGLRNVQGALVGEVVKDSPGEKAGLQSMDVILEVNGKTIGSDSDLRINISTRRPGEKVKLTVFRNKKEKKISVTLGELPEDNKEKITEDKNTGDLGISVKNIDDEIRRSYRLNDDVRGVLISNVDRNSEAGKKGLARGMIIMKIGDKRVDSVSDYRKMIRQYKSGDSVLFFVQYRGNNRFVGLTL